MSIKRKISDLAYFKQIKRSERLDLVENSESDTYDQARLEIDGYSNDRLKILTFALNVLLIAASFVLFLAFFENKEFVTWVNFFSTVYSILLAVALFVLLVFKADIYENIKDKLRGKILLKTVFAVISTFAVMSAMLGSMTDVASSGIFIVVTALGWISLISAFLFGIFTHKIDLREYKYHHIIFSIQCILSSAAIIYAFYRIAYVLSKF